MRKRGFALVDLPAATVPPSDPDDEDRPSDVFEIDGPKIALAIDDEELARRALARGGRLVAGRDAIPREYALQIGARLSLSRTPGRGACFRLHLRKADSSP